MRVVLVVLAILAVVAAAWLLLRPSTPPAEQVDDGVREPDATSGPSDVAATSPDRPDLRAVPAMSGRTGPKATRGPVPPARGKGHLVVVPVPPSGMPMPSDLRLDIELVGAKLPAPPLPLPLEDGSLRYRDLPPGEYRVRLYSDRIVDAVGTATVRDAAEERVEVKLVPGAFATVKVTTYAGEAPPTVTYSLREGRGVAVAARYEGRGETVRATPKVGESVAMPADVVVSNLRPGRYTLRATAPSGEFDEATFDAKPGEGLTLALEVRR